MARLVAIDAVAPLKSRSQKNTRDSWLKDHVCWARRRCRVFLSTSGSAGLVLLHDSIRNTWILYLKAVRAARSRYDENISSNLATHHTLYKTIDAGLSSLSSLSVDLCNRFLLFIEKVFNTRAHILHPPRVFSRSSMFWWF